MYPILTTSSQPQDFVADIRRVADEFEKLAKNLPYQYQQNVDKYDFGRMSTKFDIPDTETLYTGFSMLLLPLYRIVDSLIELDDSLEDEEDDVEHLLGEIYALKTAYLLITESFKGLEDARIRASSRGFNAQDFFRKVRQMEGIPSTEDMDKLPQYYPTTTNVPTYRSQGYIPPKWITDISWTPDFKI